MIRIRLPSASQEVFISILYTSFGEASDSMCGDDAHHLQRKKQKNLSIRKVIWNNGKKSGAPQPDYETDG